MRNIINQQIHLAYYQSGIDCSVDSKFLDVAYCGDPYDYSNKSLIGLSKFLKSKGVQKTPLDLFNILTNHLNVNDKFTSISKADLNLNSESSNRSHPSDLNLDNFEVIFDKNSLNVNLKINYVIQLMKQGKFQSALSTDTKYKILVDFSSPNIAKDMHVGHLRSTIIGDSICNLFEMLGHDVKRVNHIGDFGTQFGMVIQHLLEVYPDYENSGLTITDLQNFYAASKIRFDTEPDFKIKAYEKVVLLQSGDVEVIKAWKFIKTISKQSYEIIYKKLGIFNLEECGESFYQSLIPELIQDLESNNLLELDEGRIIIKSDAVPLTIVKADGGYTYDTTDLAAIKYRLKTLKMDKIFYVTDSGQASHFEMIFEVARKMGWVGENQELKHVSFGLVLGSNGKKLKSRSGDTVKLMELLDEAVIKSAEMSKLQQNLRTNEKKILLTNSEQDSIDQMIAYSSIKYADLASTRTNDYKFSFEKMINLKGNTFAYNAYELVRINAILKKAEEFYGHLELDMNEFVISEKEEIQLCKLLLLFPEIIDTLTEDLFFHKLCTYLYNLTCAFSTFHKKCRCMNFDENKQIVSVNNNRIIICQLTKIIIEKCFNILGLQTIEKM